MIPLLFPLLPIFKKVIFPGENDVMPGRPATIRGNGFDASDKVFIEDEQAHDRSATAQRH